jgi:hypothetical protein
MEILNQVQHDSLSGLESAFSECAWFYLRAINRQLTHYAYHVGQIVVLAKHFAAEHWETLSIPRGASEAFNQAMRDEHNP